MEKPKSVVYHYVPKLSYYFSGSKKVYVPGWMVRVNFRYKSSSRGSKSSWVRDSKTFELPINAWDSEDCVKQRIKEIVEMWVSGYLEIYPTAKFYYV